MSSLLHSRAVLSGYRRLLRASKAAFKADQFTLSQAFLRLNQEFKNNKHITDKNELGEESIRYVWK